MTDGIKKKILIFSDLSIALFSAFLGALYYYDRVELWHIYLILALQATIPLLASQDQFMRIAAVNQMIQAAGNTLGPALGALSVMMFRMPVIIAFDILGALFACILLAFVRISRVSRDKHPIRNILHELREGVGVLMEHRGIAKVTRS